MSSLSAAIMAHPQRSSWVEELSDALPFAEVVWDRMNLEWDTGRRALLAGVDQSADWHLVIQDDAVLCKDFVLGVEAALDYAHDGPVSFYMGAPRPYPQEVRRSVEKALELERSWIEMRGPIWGVCVAFPTKHLQQMVNWCDTKEGNYDSKVAEYFHFLEVQCLYTLPSLVNHRTGPSLLGHDRNTVRYAHEWIEDRSALEIDWRRGVYTAGDPSEPWREVKEGFKCLPCNTVEQSLKEAIVHACTIHEYGPFDFLAATPGAIKQMDELCASLPDEMVGTLWIVRKDFAQYSTTPARTMRAVRKPDIARAMDKAPQNFVITDVAYNFQYIGERTGWSFQGYSN